MELNPILSMLGRRLRLAVIGGGPGSFIGAMHRQAARLDDRYELVTGILSSNVDKSKKAGLELGLASDRLYSSVQELMDAESARKDGVDVVAIMTPNDSHYEYSMAALEHGFVRGPREPRVPGQRYRTFTVPIDPEQHRIGRDLRRQALCRDIPPLGERIAPDPVRQLLQKCGTPGYHGGVRVSCFAHTELHIRPQRSAQVHSEGSRSHGANRR